MIFGNGPTIGQINATGTVISSVLNVGTGNIYSALNPALGAQARGLDMEVSPSNDYITLAASNNISQEVLSDTGSDFFQSFASLGGKLFLWNGVDATVTGATSVPSYLISALETYFQNMSFFANDTFGTTFNTGSSKIVSLPGNRPPMPNAVTMNGNIMTWSCHETDTTARYLSL